MASLSLAQKPLPTPSLSLSPKKTSGPARRPHQPAARRSQAPSLGGAAPKGEIRLLGDAARGAVWSGGRRGRGRGRGSGKRGFFFFSFFFFFKQTQPKQTQPTQLSNPPPLFLPPLLLSRRAPSTRPRRQKTSPPSPCPFRRGFSGARSTSRSTPSSATSSTCSTKTTSRTTRRRSGSATRPSSSGGR